MIVPLIRGALAVSFAESHPGPVTSQIRVEEYARWVIATNGAYWKK
jgi:hypothetical protein